MAIYVFITENCRENALTHGLQQELDRFAARVEKAQSLELFANFPPPYLVKRRFGGDQGRLIAARTRVPGAEEHTIVCFLAVLIRGSKDYDHGFGVNPVEYGQQHFQHLYTQDELFDWLAARLQKPTLDRALPTETESHFLHAVSGAVTGEEDWTIAESKSWVQKIGKPDVVVHLGAIADAVGRVTTKARDSKARSSFENAGGTWAILWRSYPTERLLILEDVVPNNEQDPIKLKHHPAEPPNSRELLLKRCRRAYLDIIVADQKLWIDIQRDTEGNLALSPEEQEVIDSTRPGTGSSFPLFINGRAGSGKSTVLQYLFADYLMAYLELIENGQFPKEPGQVSKYPAQGPVYFTCSKDLLKRAATTVDALLRNGAQFWQNSQRTALLNQHRGRMASAFCELRSFLLSLVAPNDRQLFDERNYVSYARYQRLWMDKFSKDRDALRQQGPALSWHVIRTHIKGATADDILDPDEYELLDKKQRTVSREAFERIYQRVWERWYRRKSDGEHLWDDQDLARYLLDRDLAKPLFHAIFCDEAQDFTSVELQVILRLSIFSCRKLGQNEFKRVPFVFAGDPFQTLNPTGFRWETTKASYFKNFVLSLDPWGNPETDLNYRELSHNYRSSRSIVGFSNLIQAQRSKLFEIKHVRPQQVWADEENPLPVYWFDLGDGAFWSEFSKQKDLVVVVPCAEGGEATFVKGDDELKSRVSVKGDTPDNVWSAARAKGLEFDRVVLYRFGDSEEAKQLQQRVRSGEAEDAGKRLLAEYFFNQLYVAASRAKHGLFVVDSQNSIKRFWEFASTESLDEALKMAPGGGALWKPLVAQMVKGEIENLRTFDYKAVQTAEVLEQQGMAAESSYTLRQAAVHFRNANNYAAAERCEAFAALFEGKFRDAARAFLQQKRWDEAVRAFWMDGAEGRKELRSVGENEADISRKLEWRIAHALDAKTADVTVWSSLLDDVARNARENQAQWRPEERKSWSDALVNGVTRIASAPKTQLAQAGWIELFEKIDTIFKLGVCQADNKDLAIIAVRSGRFKEALRLFEAAGAEVGKFDTQPDEFTEAVAESVDFPDNLTALLRMNRVDQLVSVWHSKGEPSLRGTEGEDTLVDALIRHGDFTDALTVAVGGVLHKRVIEVATHFLETKDEHNAQRAILCAIMLLAQKNEWNQVLHLLKTTPIAPHEKGELSWEGVLKERFLWGLERALASAKPVNDNEIGPKLADRVSAAVRGIDFSNEEEVRLLGTAIENTGQISPAVDYYEKCVANAAPGTTTEEFRSWLRQRLLKTKWKRSQARMKKNPEAARSDMVGVRNELSKWKLGSPEEIAEFPDRINAKTVIDQILAGSWELSQENKPATNQETSQVSEVAPTVQPTFEMEKIQILGIEIQINRVKKRLTVTRPPSDDRVRLTWDDIIQCESDPKSEPAGKSRWSIPEWGIEVGFSDDRHAEVRWPLRRIDLRFDGNYPAPEP